MNLFDQETQKIIELIQAGKSLPAIYRSKLFDSEDLDFIESTKYYKQVCNGKAFKEIIIASTPSAPL